MKIARLEIILKNRPEEKKRLLQALQGFAVEHQLPAPAIQAADLALEEHLTNVMSYGYTDAASHDIHIRLSCDDRSLLIEVEDDGREFDPLTCPKVDTSVPLDERNIGGLGIHLMRQFMDALEYRREGDRNILRLTKRLRP